MQGDDPTPDVETFDAPANGEFYPIGGDHHRGVSTDRRHAACPFKDPDGQSDDQTCTLAASGTGMTCQGVLNDGQGHTMNYVDVYDQM